MTRRQKTTSARFGHLVGPEDAAVQGYDDMPMPGMAQDERITEMVESPLWDYMNTGKLNGIPVNSMDLGLKIDSDDMVQAAFQLERVPRSLLLYMSPDDPESIRKYDEVMERAYRGEVMLVDEQKQFDPSKGKFIVWLRYDEVQYALHPRFQYLREE